MTRWKCFLEWQWCTITTISGPTLQTSASWKLWPQWTKMTRWKCFLEWQWCTITTISGPTLQTNSLRFYSDDKIHWSFGSFLFINQIFHLAKVQVLSIWAFSGSWKASQKFPPHGSKWWHDCVLEDRLSHHFRSESTQILLNWQNNHACVLRVR
jgi:hypothetical protein